MEISPDHILNYLGELNVSAYSKDDRIYFGLLLTQATDKNFLPLLPCDSLIDAALDYYVKKDGIHWARAWFYKGRIQRQMKMTEELFYRFARGRREYERGIEVERNDL